jgi:hypothetical protein
MKVFKNLISQIKYLRGEGTIYVITIVSGVIIFGGYLVGGVLPEVFPGGNSYTDPPPPPPQVEPGQSEDITPPPPDTCSANIAIDFLVDSSDEMIETAKPQIVAGLKEFSGKLTDNNVIALHTFGSLPVKEPIPFSPYKDVKSRFDQTLSGLTPDGATYIRSAFSYVKTRIQAAQTRYPDHKFQLVFISDGVPEIDACNPDHMPNNTCAQGLDARNYDYTENPIDPRAGANIADEIKSLGVRVFVIALYDDADVRIFPQLSEMMRGIASVDSYYETANAADLERIYREISAKVCI